MKGIVVEINLKDAVILADDGLFIKIKNKKYEVGQTIKIEENKKAGSKWIAGAAGMVAAAAICTTGAFAYYTPTDYISLDVNPSVEYSINMFDRILDVKAVNDDGEELLTGLALNHKTIEDGVKETLDKLIDGGYLSDDPNGGVVITTSNDEFDQAEQLAADLEQEVQTYLDNRKGIAAKVEAEAVEPERVVEARELGVTPGKLNLVDKLQESTNGAIKTEDWLSMPVKEINKAIKENRKQSRDQERSDTEDNPRDIQDDDQNDNEPRNRANGHDRDKQVFDQNLKDDDRDSDWKYRDREEKDRDSWKNDEDDWKKLDDDDWKKLDDDDRDKGGWKNKDEDDRKNKN